MWFPPFHSLWELALPELKCCFCSCSLFDAKLTWFPHPPVNSPPAARDAGAKQGDLETASPQVTEFPKEMKLSNDTGAT